MELSRLLGTSFECDCGRAHNVPVREFVYERGVIGSLPEIVRHVCAPGSVRRVVVVADVRTWRVSGEQAYAALAEARFEVDRIIVPDEEHGDPVCDEKTLGALVTELHRMKRDLVVAVGSGVINDLCKWASYELGLPYVVVATAASMNGYAAANVAPWIAGVKVLVGARPPLAVVAEPTVIEHGPAEMTAAGFGDAIARYQSNADWKMNHLLLDEYYCDFCGGIVAGLDHLYLEYPEDIARGNEGALRGLFETLFWSGVAMTLAGTSAPASGGEHLFSHTLDMMASVHGHGHDLHGRQVGLGTVLSAALYEKVLTLENPRPVHTPALVDERFWVVASTIEAVRAQYEAKKQSLEMVRERIVKPAVWAELKATLAGEVKKPETIRDWLRRAGAACAMADIGCSRQRIRSAVLHMHEIRKRFTIVDLAWLVGILPQAADELIDEWLTGDR